MSKLMKLTIIAHTYHIKRHIKRYKKDYTVLSPADSVCLYLLLNVCVIIATSGHISCNSVVQTCQVVNKSHIAFSFKTSTVTNRVHWLFKELSIKTCQ